VEQLAVQVPLEIGYVSADRGARDAEGRRGTREGMQLRHAGEALHAGELIHD
jgi:hypothetical protein